MKVGGEMSKKVLLLCGSPRKQGNTTLLGDAFVSGAEENGCFSERVFIVEKNINGCIGCIACRTNGGHCVQKDDMKMIYEKMIEADAIVLVSPVYFYTWTSQMKAVIDRTFAIEKLLKNKTFYLISAGAAPNESYVQTMIDSFKQYVECFTGEGNKEGGYVFGYDARKHDDVKDTDAMEKAYELGKTV